MSATSMALLAAALWLGSAVGGPWVLAPVGVALLGAAAALRIREVGVLLLAAAALVAIGAGGAGARIALSESGPVAQLARVGGTATIQGRLATDPRPLRAGGSWALLRVRRLDDARVRTTAAVRLPADAGTPVLGSGIVIRASGRPLDRHGFDGHLRRLGATVLLTPTTVEVRPPRAGLATVAEVRARVRAASSAHLDPERAALLTGLVTGDTTGMPAEAEQRYVDAGLSHLVAVSGSNVALVMAGALGVGAALRLGHRGRRVAAAIAIVAFVVLVRGEPSVLRAAAVAGLVLVAELTGRARDRPHLLASAVVVLLLVDPLLARSLGFALSVLATAGVLVVAPALARRLRGPAPLVSVLAATLGAQLAVAPLLLVREEGIPLAAVPANAVAVPAAAVGSAVAVAVALLAQVATGPAGWLALVAVPALEVIVVASRGFAWLPSLDRDGLTQPGAALLALAVALLVLRRRAPRAVGAGLLALAAATPLVVLRPPAPVDALTVTTFDVGQGDAVLVEAPGPAGTARMLVDGGPDPEAIVRILRRLRVRALDVVVATHPHADHTDGLPEVLRRLRVGALLIPAGAPSGPGTAPSAGEAVAIADSRHVPVVVAAAGLRFLLGSAPVHVLSPPRGDVLPPEPNERSLVLRVGSPPAVALLTGEAEVVAQSRLLARPDLLRAAVLKVPHHGAATNAPAFLEAVGARVAVVSVGAGNGYGHPHDQTLSELAGAEVRRTDLEGTVRIDVWAVAASYTAGRAAVAVDPAVHRPRGAPAAAGGRSRHRGAARIRGRRTRGRSRRRAAGRWPARPADGVAVRRPARGPPARRAGPAATGRGRTQRPARRRAA